MDLLKTGEWPAGLEGLANQMGRWSDRQSRRGKVLASPRQLLLLAHRNRLKPNL